MKEQIKKFCEDKKDIIKNTIIMVAVPLAGVCLYNINRMNKIMEKENIKELFYEDVNENSTEDEA